MVLQASGSISMSQIRGEFGGSAPDSLSEYYRGGGLVPDTPTNATIPTSGSISFSDFYSTSAASVTDHATTINVGAQGIGYYVYYSPFTYYQAYIYGYDGGLDYIGRSSVGSIGDATYTDASTTVRTITSVYWYGFDLSGGPPDPGVNGSLFITLSGESIPDTDDTFIGLDINGTYFDRSDRISYFATSNPSGGTTWLWQSASPALTNPFGTSGTINFIVDVV